MIQTKISQALGFATIYQIYQAMQQESIYNIIARNPEESPRKPIYRSKYPYNIPPTGSTFCHHTTSKPGISNLSGQFTVGLQAHTPIGATQTFGHVRGLRKSSPTQFRKRGTGTMGSNELPPVRNFSYDCAHKKQKVPLSHEKPVYGQRSNKNFIISNAIENILSSAKQPPKQTDWTKKKDYGKTPEYINMIKTALSNQYQMIRTLQAQRQQKKKVLSSEQLHELREGLKNKWNQINKQYQNMTHIRIIDTQGLKRRKEWYESQLKQIQDDIRKLNREYIFVEG